MSRRRVRIEPLADQDVDVCFAFIARDNMRAATRFLEALQSDYLKLLRMPGMGAKREFLNPKYAGIRSWPVTDFGNYLIFYRQADVGIRIVRVLHGARDIEAIFEEF